MNALVQTNTKTVATQAVAVSATEAKQYLTFMLGGEMFSLGILCIKEIIWYANLTEVPMMPACIRGVINLRGAVVPVLDLSNRFGKPSTPVVKSSCIVIVEVPTAVEGEHQSMGIVVDSVQAVLEIPTTEIEPAPSFGAKIRSEFIEGIAKVDGKFVILLDVGKVLSMQEIGQMGQAGQVAALVPQEMA
ncbi:chemotaxis protein CheW [Rhodoferax sp.]|uniref:chemotaxis protein CheW n=1 Tax=Rhodoferax sp. TaxID=50421 RepID=UPI0026338DD5|nr:chemotaxis protein CheW [Rhodoferax sp.]MDD2810057.1 chemotaxis protein CheW [Rhodoferax sp.]MDD4944732.1 chemotaxis protein CheW [Rhodoferax sp.]